MSRARSPRSLWRLNLPRDREGTCRKDEVMAVSPLKPEELRWRCPPEALDFETTDEVKPTGEIVGQARAIMALKLGLEIPSIGYNMFVTGVSGTGRETTIKRILEGMDTTTGDLRDIMYVRNMEEPSNPVVLTFPAGDGSRYEQD